jgi:phosphoglucomutase
MRRFESDGLGYEYVYGTEESYGHLVENEVRDKDGISAAALTAEMTLYWRSKGKSLLERLEELYVEHGYFEEKSINKYFEGPTGMEIMKGIMEGYRRSQPTSLGGISVARIRDVGTGLEWAVGTPGSAREEARKIDLPTSDVIQWVLADSTKVTVRPSGTEPKIKFYILLSTEVEGGRAGLAAARGSSAAKAEAIAADIGKAIGAIGAKAAGS